MSHARASDSRPQYFGGDLLTHRSDAGLRMSEVDYGSARAWAPHTHWRAFFALLLRGGYVEALGRTELGYRPLDLGFHPESTRHTDRIAADDTRFFLLELDESWIRRLSECGGKAALAPRMCGGRSHELALRLYREFRAGDPDDVPTPTPTLWTEGLVLELLAGLLPEARTGTRHPGWPASSSGRAANTLGSSPSRKWPGRCTSIRCTSRARSAITSGAPCPGVCWKRASVTR